MWKLLPWAATDKMDSRKARVILPRNVTNRKKAIQKIKDPREKHIAELKQIAQEAANTKAAYERRQREKGLQNWRLSAPGIYNQGSAITINDAAGKRSPAAKRPSGRSDATDEISGSTKRSVAKRVGTASSSKSSVHASSSKRKRTQKKDRPATSSSSKGKAAKKTKAPAKSSSSKGRITKLPNAIEPGVTLLSAAMRCLSTRTDSPDRRLHGSGICDVSLTSSSGSWDDRDNSN